MRGDAEDLKAWWTPERKQRQREIAAGNGGDYAAATKELWAEWRADQTAPPIPPATHTAPELNGVSDLVVAVTARLDALIDLGQRQITSLNDVRQLLRADHRSTPE
jgi:hypothetical protein